MYYAQEGKLYCENPRDDKGAVEVATCAEVNGIKAKEVAEKLAFCLNFIKTDKSKADQKDEHLEKIFEYMVTIQSKDIPRFINDAFHRAYEI